MFTDGNFDIRIVWLTRKVKTLFHIKDKCQHLSCKIYQGICSCGETYVGETVRNVEVRWNEHNNPNNKKSNASKHLKSNIEHVFTWAVISNAPKNKFKRKVIEAYIIEGNMI